MAKKNIIISRAVLGNHHLTGIFLIALSSLLLEFNLTRILSISMWYHFAFMVISVALLGIGMSGIFLSLFPKVLEKPADKVLSVLSIIYGACVILCFILMNKIVIDPFSLLSQKYQLILLPIYYLIITIPFFISGLIISYLITTFQEDVRKLYFFDLTGAGLSCFLFVFLIPLTGGNGLIVIISAIGFLAAAVFSFSKHKAISLISFALVFLVFIFLIDKEKNLKIAVTPNKIYANYIAQRPDLNLLTEWNTFSKVDVMKEEEASPDGYNILLAIIDEGNATTNIPNVKTLPPPKKPADASNLAFTSKDSAKNVFVIGSGGGGEILTSLYHNAEKVTGVEINGILNNLISDRLAGWTGPLIKNNKKVNIITDDARSVIRGSKEKYDVIISAHTISSSAVSSGAMSMVENYILTKEAVKDYLLHLDKTGIIYISRPETQIPKILTTIRTACSELEIRNGKDNYAVFRRHPNTFEEEQGAENAKSFMAGVIYKRDGFKNEDILALRNEADLLNLSIEYDALMTEENEYSKVLTSDLNSIILKNPGKLNPATDERPFFDDNFSFTDVNLSTIKDVFSRDDKAILALKDKPVAQVTLIVMFIQIFLVSGILLLLPLVFFKKKLKNIEGKNFLIFFACIGLGYIIIQISLIQKFTLFLGQPVYTMLTVISTMLIASGFGSNYSKKITNDNIKKISEVFVAIIILTALTGIFASSLFNLFSGLHIIFRIIISIIIIAPTGFLLGIPFPTGISSIRQEEKSLIPVSWAINGFFSVTGTVITMILAMTIGFKLLFLLASMLYLAALYFISKRYKRI